MPPNTRNELVEVIYLAAHWIGQWYNLLQAHEGGLIINLAEGTAETGRVQHLLRRCSEACEILTLHPNVDPHLTGAIVEELDLLNDNEALLLFSSRGPEPVA